MNRWLYLLFFLPLMCHAMTWQDLWQRPDQQAMTLLNKHHANAAAEHFTRPQWKAIAQYRAKNYPAAVNEFSKDISATGFYNKGNALALQHQYAGAIKAYQTTLKLKPDFSDATYNLNIINKLQKQHHKKNKPSKDQKKKQQQNKQDPTQPKTSKQQNSQEKQKPQKKSSSKSNKTPSHQKKQHQRQQKPPSSGPKHSKQKSQKSQLVKKTPQSNSQKQTSQRKPTQQQQKLKKEKAEKVHKPMTKAEEARLKKMRQTKHWLAQIPDNPGGLLKQKFLRDYQRRQKEQ